MTSICWASATIRAWQEIFPQGRQTPDALADFQKAGIDKLWPVIKAANIKPE